MKALRPILVAALCGACEPQFVDAVGVPVEPEAGVSAPPPSLLHRYRFDGAGTEVTDARGAAHGLVVNTTLTDAGSLTLAGTSSGQHVDLPNGLVSGLSDATFEAWVIWNGGVYWQRIFDFGNSFMGSGTSYLFLTPKGTDENGFLRLVHSTGGVPGETAIDGPTPLPIQELSHVVAVIDDQNDKMFLYLNGILQGSTDLADRLSDIDDVNNWLGRSNYPADNGFSGIYYEFRIYDSALSEQDIVQSYAAGADAKLVGEP